MEHALSSYISQPEPIWTTRRQVLVADDDRDLRRLMARALRRAGHDVVELEDGDRLLRYLGLTLAPGLLFAAPDLVITDVRMPGASGIDVLSVLRHASRRTPVILVTALEDEHSELAIEASELGAAALLHKPFSMERLLELAMDLTTIDR